MTIVLVSAALFGWGLLSARLERVNLTAPLVLIAVGGTLAGLGLIDGPSAPETATPLVEVTPTRGITPASSRWCPVPGKRRL